VRSTECERREREKEGWAGRGVGKGFMMDILARDVRTYMNGFSVVGKRLDKNHQSLDS
jgi:hypothetical protein